MWLPPPPGVCSQSTFVWPESCSWLTAVMYLCMFPVIVLISFFFSSLSLLPAQLTSSHSVRSRGAAVGKTLLVVIKHTGRHFYSNNKRGAKRWVQYLSLLIMWRRCCEIKGPTTGEGCWLVTAWMATVRGHQIKTDWFTLPKKTLMCWWPDDDGWLTRVNVPMVQQLNCLVCSYSFPFFNGDHRLLPPAGADS